MQLLPFCFVWQYGTYLEGQNLGSLCVDEQDDHCGFISLL